ncbi:AraC family transcriptional regulator [Shewanella basaltis]|uniref:helix-turn-helix domain-containing protein n=1 Tax=Shewanella basaltis TaxID=472183 RepID=UPI00200D7B76|nr:AraC family transcriptional regulator [Shewanella basaltis]MCL1112036.1 AraC family transcriptional regulator [Shewanella basaltis]
MDTCFSKVELSRKIKDAGYDDAFINVSHAPSKSFMAGDICFQTLPNGIDIHCANITENVDGYSCSQLSPGISINVLLHGRVCFALEHQRYEIEANEQPALFINVMNDQQVFTRFFNQQQAVKKISLSVSKAWLLARCSNAVDRQDIEQIFGASNSVFQWPCEASLLTLVHDLYQKTVDETLCYQWEVEQIALQFFCQSFRLLTSTVTQQSRVESSTCCMNDACAAIDHDFEAKIESLLYESLSLPQLASRLGASISTLQRYFKSRHQLTLKEYMRNQILEHARRRLIFEGKSIGEVAYLAGYNHVSNFSSAFKKYFSITPVEMQNRYRDIKNLK